MAFDVLYVSTEGDDSLSGATPGTAKATIAAALAALPAAGGTVYIGAGAYAESDIALRSRTTLIGSPGAMVLSAGHAFVVGAPTVAGVSIRGLNIRTDGSAFDIAGTLALSDIQAIITQRTGTAPAIRASGLIDTRWNLEIAGAAGAARPLIELIGTAGHAINANAFTGRSTHGASCVFHIEDATGNSYASNNHIYDWNFELPTAGAVRLLSGRGNIIENVGVYDLPAPARASLIYVGRSLASALKSQGNHISVYVRLGGTLAPGVYDVELESGNALSTAIESSSATSGLAVNWGGNTGACINSKWGINEGSVAHLGPSGVKQVAASKAGWYAPTYVPAGTQFFDTDSKKLLTSDGAMWRDAMGTIVM